MNEPDNLPDVEIVKSKKRAWIYDLLLVLILLVGAALRLRGIYWGEFTFMHPDERFLVWVGTDIQPTGSETLGDAPAASRPGMASERSCLRACGLAAKRR